MRLIDDAAGSLAWATILPLVLAWGCATGPVPKPGTAVASTGPGNAVGAADGGRDAAYYRERASALASESANEIGRTDFARFRRGRLYDRGFADGKAQAALQKELTGAFERDELNAVLDITAKVLVEDQADIRAHMLRGISLRKMQRQAEADFHRGVAVGMIKSIMDSGDGRSPTSAWTVFRVKEEYEIMKVIGCVVESQALSSAGGRHFDVLDARRVSDGATIRAYFDITELSAQEERAFLSH